MARIPLPQWVLKEMDKDPDLACSDRFGRRNIEYISLGCDILPILNGRSPIQVYADFMKNFRDTFRLFLGGIITVGMICKMFFNYYFDLLVSLVSKCGFQGITFYICRGFKLEWDLEVN